MEICINVAMCRNILPKDNVLTDDSDASVGSDYPNCCVCDVWMMALGCKKQLIGIALTIQKRYILCITVSDDKALKKLCFSLDISAKHFLHSLINISNDFSGFSGVSKFLRASSC